MLLKNRKLYTRNRTPAGSSPGQITRPEETTDTSVTLILYNKDHIEEIAAPGLDQIRQCAAVSLACFGPPGGAESEAKSEAKTDAGTGIETEASDTARKVWLNITGLADVDFLKEIADIFNIHPIALEDIVHPNQRPKTDAYEDQLLLMTRMAHVLEHDEILDLEQVSLVLRPGAVITFQLRPGDCFEPVRQRLRKTSGRIRQYGVDYLAYALLDAIVDGYFPVLEKFSEAIDRLENRVLDNPTEDMIEDIHHLRRDLLTLRRVLWPQREMLRPLVQESDDLIEDHSVPFFRDCLDHSILLLDVLETHRERASGLMDFYLSSLSHKMNEVMKVLTLFATIFMPLGFIAGLYGMNFNPDVSPWNMPELGLYYGYPLALLLMAGLALAMIVYFARKKWIRLLPGRHTKNLRPRRRSKKRPFP